MTATKDHTGKTSQARVSALFVTILTTIAACIVAVAPVFGGPAADVYVLGALLFGGQAPSGLALYQKLKAPQESRTT